ncbi:NADH-quinone oxidoreductase subunit L [Jongsikchunia kroppenstedtii]|uniref:NADH-quinone oxidoreductase subunit L n=1 Tax=Jongsikchunia kroppenstedtii TaxID=1121721 RepID=UPI0003784C7C|nr:NADH-quinone oxidoreductase subunit L [Jongsikchunia kroppenstedtii]
MNSTLWLLPALPLAGAAVLLLGGRRLDRVGHLIGVLMAVASFVVALIAAIVMIGRSVADRPMHEHLFSWVPVASLRVDFGLQIDQLTLCFVLLITGVGSLIHIYSVGYMADDPGRRRFFGYLDLFLGAMLILVMADNFLGLYLGWEGVGLASYLLIGFWQHKPSAATAAKKAFVVNRVGDLGLAIALMIMFHTFGSLSFADVFGSADRASESTLTALGFMLLLAACGKSAQVPLQSWLGDAMEGPTPVSALIHAATMVTAGVYLVTRANPIFDLAPHARTGVIVVGAVTLMFGAIIGCAKDDIKKALAASTMSQIGYMVLATGLGPAGYVFAIAHLLTHGFFKAGLFLGAGSVMHAMDDETDMRRYGGLRTLMPITFATFGFGYLAIIGVPPFSGFFSKDRIIEAAFASDGAGGWILGIVALLGAGLTAFYMTRVMVLTFFGKPRWRQGDSTPHPHEAPTSMTAPMVLLAIGSIAAGGLLLWGDSIVSWLSPAVPYHHSEPPIPSWSISLLALAVVAIGIAVAVRQYAFGEVADTAPVGTPITIAARRDLYGDAFNEAAFMRPGQQLTTALTTGDTLVIDGAVGGVSRTIGLASTALRRMQTGYVRSYAVSMLAGTLVVAAVLMVVGLR